MKRASSANATAVEATYVIAAADNTFFACRYSFSLTISKLLICFIALLLASNSTGKVTIENNTANDINAIPIQSAVEPNVLCKLVKTIPANTAMQPKELPIFAKGTNEVLNLKKKYPWACCIACPTSWAAIAVPATEGLLKFAGDKTRTFLLGS